MSVLIQHYAVVFWMSHKVAAQIGAFPPITDLAIPNFAMALSSTPVILGQFGVGLFFLVSGFVIPYSFLQLSSAGFLVGRAWRIYPTYIAGFAITLAALATATNIFYVAFPYSAREVLVHAVPGLRDLLGSPPIDYVVWTLEVEVKFYLVCALLAPWLRRGSMLVFVAPAVMACLVIMAPPWLPPWHESHVRLYQFANAVTLSLPLIVYMFIGVALNYVQRGVQPSILMMAVSAFLFAALMTDWTFGISSVAHLGWSYGAAAIVFVTAMSFQEAWPNGRATRFFADVSYPLYVCHPVLGYLTLRLLAGAAVPAPLAVLLAAAVALLTAYFLHKVVETPTHRIGQRLARRISAHRQSGRRLVSQELSR